LLNLRSYTLLYLYLRINKLIIIDFEALTNILKKNEFINYIKLLFINVDRMKKMLQLDITIYRYLP